MIYVLITPEHKSTVCKTGKISFRKDIQSLIFPSYINLNLLLYICQKGVI
jgi:hypothetical protein